jgi:hypothetical protein
MSSSTISLVTETTVANMYSPRTLAGANLSFCPGLREKMAQEGSWGGGGGGASKGTIEAL